MLPRLVILDRDGVINQESRDFVKSPDEWQPIAGSLEAIGLLSAAGFEVAVASNQSGVGRKLIDPPVLEAIHRKMQQLAREAGGDIGRIVCCPHRPEDGCDCRKPLPGLLRQLGRHYGMPLDKVPMIGDSVRDIDAAIAVRGRPILVLTGNGREAAKELAKRGTPVETYADLHEAAVALVAEKGKH